MNRKDENGVEFTYDWLSQPLPAMKVFLTGPTGFRCFNADTKEELKVGSKFRTLYVEKISD